MFFLNAHIFTLENAVEKKRPDPAGSDELVTPEHAAPPSLSSSIYTKQGPEATLKGRGRKYRVCSCNVRLQYH